MSTFVGPDEVAALGASSLREHEQRVSALSKDLCASFHAEAGKMETELQMIYKVVVMRVREEPDLTCIATVWAAMVSMCDEFAERLSSLANEHPNCGADFYHNRVLDLRNKCQRLQNMHSSLPPPCY